MLAQFVQNFLGLERRKDVFDQHGRLDGAARNAQFVLCHIEDIVPQARFQVMLHFGQIKVRAGSAIQQLAGVVEKIHGKVEQTARHGRTIHMQVLFRQMPAARADQQCRCLVIQTIGLAFRRLKRDPPTHRIAQVLLPRNEVVPGRRGGVLKVGHENSCAAVQRVDDHFAVGRPGDFHAAILQVRRNWSDPPFSVANRLGFRQKVRHRSRVDRRLAHLSLREQLLTPRLELPVQLRAERQGRGCQYAVIFGLLGGADRNPAGAGYGGWCCVSQRRSPFADCVNLQMLMTLLFLHRTTSRGSSNAIPTK